MRYYRVREWKIPGPKPKPVKAKPVKKGEKSVEASPPPPPVMLSRFRKVERNTDPAIGARDLCDHDHVTRQDADGCPVAATAMEKAGYVGEEDQASRDHTKRQEAHEARVKAAQDKEAAAAE